MRICTAAQMREAEAAAVSAGTSYEALMENAGQKSAEKLLNGGLQTASVLILCGKGNNGGDGLVVARLLAQAGWNVQLALLCGVSLSPLSQLNFDRLSKNVSILPIEKLKGEINTVTYIIDAVFGTGFHGTLPLPIQEIFQTANRSKGYRISLDIPSGLNCDTGEASPHTFRADQTYTFGAYKPALLMDTAKTYVGTVSCLDIGL